VPKGLKPVRKRLADGTVRLYWYHRATGQRLEHEPETAEGFIEVAALDATAKTIGGLSDAPAGSYAAIWAAYRQSERWRALKPRTRSDYQAVRDWLGEGAHRMLPRLATKGDIIRLRDKAASEKGRRFANYVVQVVRLTLEWALDREMIKLNPAKGVKMIPRPRGARKVNRAWDADEVEAYLTDCPFQLAVPFALGLFAGMRQGDALIVTWTIYDGALLNWIAGKNGEECWAPVTALFKKIIDRAHADRGNHIQIALNSYREAWSASGFRASFFKRIRTLQAAGKLRPGCTFHGLRHTIGTMARDDNQSDSRVAAAIGDKSTAMAEVYGRDHDREGAQIEVLKAVQKHFENVDWKL
jgi:integrase